MFVLWLPLSIAHNLANHLPLAQTWNTCVGRGAGMFRRREREKKKCDYQKCGQQHRPYPCSPTLEDLVGSQDLADLLLRIWQENPQQRPGNRRAKDGRILPRPTLPFPSLLMGPGLVNRHQPTPNLQGSVDVVLRSMSHACHRALPVVVPSPISCKQPSSSIGPPALPVTQIQDTPGQLDTITSNPHLSVVVSSKVYRFPILLDVVNEHRIDLALLTIQGKTAQNGTAPVNPVRSSI